MVQSGVPAQAPGVVPAMITPREDKRSINWVETSRSLGMGLRRRYHTSAKPNRLPPIALGRATFRPKARSSQAAPYKLVCRPPGAESGQGLDEANKLSPPQLNYVRVTT